MTVTYNFSYDSETNIVTVAAITKSEEKIIEVEDEYLNTIEVKNTFDYIYNGIKIVNENK